MCKAFKVHNITYSLETTHKLPVKLLLFTGNFCFLLYYCNKNLHFYIEMAVDFFEIYYLCNTVSSKKNCGCCTNKK